MTRLAVAAFLAAAFWPATASADKGEVVTMRAAKDAISLDVSARSFRAAVGAGPAVVTYDDQGAQHVEYLAVAADYSLGRCERRSARRVRCAWHLWVTVQETGAVIHRERGASVARLVLKPRRDVVVADDNITGAMRRDGVS